MKKLKISDCVFNILNYMFMAFVALCTLYPFMYVLFASFSNPTEFVKSSGLLLKPAGFSFESYMAVLNNKDIYIGYANTLFYVGVGTILQTMITALFAYPLSQSKLKYAKLINVMVVVTLFFAGGMIPNYLVVQKLGLLNTRWAIIIPNLIATYNLLVMKSAYAAVPSSLDDSARIDGANEFQSFLFIILPNVKATIAVIVLYYGVASWNSWFSALLYIQDRMKYPLQLFLREILMGAGSKGMGNYSISAGSAFREETIKHATTVVATVPILCIYPFIQRYFVKGVMIGAVKE